MPGQIPALNSSQPVSAMPVVTRLPSGARLQQPSTKSTISPPPATAPVGFWGWVKSWIRRILSLFSFSRKPADPSHSLPLKKSPTPSPSGEKAPALDVSKENVAAAAPSLAPSAVPTPIPTTGRTPPEGLEEGAPIAWKHNPFAIQESAAATPPPSMPSAVSTPIPTERNAPEPSAPQESVAAAPPPSIPSPVLAIPPGGQSLKLHAPKMNFLTAERIAAVKKFIEEHLTKITPDRESALDEEIPEKKWGLVIWLKCNEQGQVFAKKWDSNLRKFLTSQAESFLSTERQEIISLDSILFQKTDKSKINFFARYTVLVLPSGVQSAQEAFQTDCSFEEFEGRMRGLLPIDSERRAALKNFPQLKKWIS
jgi:hypothetical protein